MKWSGWKQAQGRHASASHREATRGAQRPAPRVEMVLAQRAALVPEKAASEKGVVNILRKGNHERMGQGQPPDQKILFLELNSPQRLPQPLSSPASVKPRLPRAPA